MPSPPAPLLKGDDEGNVRLVIWGNSGAGKSTLAKRLAVALPQLKVIAMDDLLFNDGWVKTPPDEFDANLHRLTTENDSLVTDGNYLKRRHGYLPRATDIIWLDWPLHITLWRLLKRTWQRWRTAELLFGTSDVREDWRVTLFSRESIIWHRPVRRELSQILRDEPEVSATSNRRFARPSELEQWIATIEEEQKGR
ncbi:hypothetical protein Rhopal_001068-T1 [Rhodotorula paludigena]|uniref:Adenylate kinase n=1 Tax=Rhodotorula paludigena TaxID=86838 RepID=A0AAV5GFI5_9BASI|nr:hypothetical protein Rhopal_001068-T1 [Rhodotorula paludigena]